MAAVDGDWDVTVKSPMGDQKSVLTINSNGDTFSGKMAGSLGSMDIPSGTVNGNTLSWKMDMTVPMPMTLDCTATVDGDTITVLDAQRQQHVIRLAGIDAPEKSQPYGQKSKAHLSQAVFGQTVTVTFDKRDRYGRIVGQVRVLGEDANLRQLQAGWAWHYKQYQNEQTPDQRSVYDAAERAAREKRLGLWQGQGPASPEPPWDYRARLKSERQSAQHNTPLTESRLQ